MAQRRTPMHSRSPHAGEFVSVRLTNSRVEIDRAQERLIAQLKDQGYGESARFAVRLAVEEALTNAFSHGHKGLAPETPALFEFSVGASEVVMVIEDQGPGFKPADVPDPTLDENLEIPSGRGLLLMRAYMSKVEFSERGNRLTMVYRRPEGK